MTEPGGATDLTVPATASWSNLRPGSTSRRPEDTTPRSRVLLVDFPEVRVRRARDLVELIGSGVGIAVVLLLAVYAHATAIGVTEDVQSAVAAVLRQLLLLPVTILEGLVTFFVPLVVLALELVRRRWRTALEALTAGIVAALVTAGAAFLLDTYGATALTIGLTITTEGHRVVAMNPVVAALAALLTTVGPRGRRRAVRWSWSLLWGVIVLSVLRGALTLPGAVVTVLLGRAVGLGMRYAAGVLNVRATGVSLVRGLRRAGLDPARVVRLDATEGEPQAWTVTTTAPIGYTEQGLDISTPVAAEPPAPTMATAAKDDGAAPTRAGGAPRRPDTIVPDALVDPATVIADLAAPGGVTLDALGAHRVYSVHDTAGKRWYVTVLDGDRHVVGYLSSLWSTLRVRGLAHRRSATLRDTADRAVLLAYAAERAGVRIPPLVGLAEASDSVLFVSEHIPGARRLVDMDPEDVGDDVLDAMWSELRTAHVAGIAHQDLTTGAILVGTDAAVWLTDWENGEIASAELTRRLDQAQLLALTAIHVGEERALASASRSLRSGQLAALAPLLQPVILTGQARAAAGKPRELLNSLRARLVDEVPAADVEPVRLARFSVRTVVMVSIAVVAVWLLLGSLNFEQVVAAARDANPWWLLATFVLGVITYLGSAMGLVAFSPERLGLVRTTLVQAAAGVVTLVAPAGVGPAALNLRFLTKQKVKMPLAVATVTLVQVSQFVTTVLLLVAMALITGSAGTLSLPTGAVNAVAVTTVALVAIVLLVPPLRSWLWLKVGPTLQQVWPRLLWVVGSPSRLLMGIGGNLIMTIGYVASFGAALAAFGYTLAPTTLAITYLTSNTVGAAVPSPGGIGPVEAALTAGLTVSGIPAGVAFSTALVFRVLTFWARVPIGWVALRYLQRRGDV
ncbi:lysylphosphatidylglycerol synthase transmembrane domain-containing protein [Georgenia sp. MJ170]|uniref:lysylphosphatidylglycerol synthase transmembrane domain-containing protein n=1 Tax=Georgenia sunbinii TaxID=3117728 RepID=UPI002F261445